MSRANTTSRLLTPTGSALGAVVQGIDASGPLGSEVILALKQGGADQPGVPAPAGARAAGATRASMRCARRCSGTWGVDDGEVATAPLSRPSSIRERPSGAALSRDGTGLAYR
jgi:hypothetical protein